MTNKLQIVTMGKNILQNLTTLHLKSVSIKSTKLEEMATGKDTIVHKRSVSTRLRTKVLVTLNRSNGRRLGFLFLSMTCFLLKCKISPFAKKAYSPQIARQEYIAISACLFTGRKT